MALNYLTIPGTSPCHILDFAADLCIATSVKTGRELDQEQINMKHLVIAEARAKPGTVADEALFALICIRHNIDHILFVYICTMQAVCFYTALWLCPCAN